MITDRVSLTQPDESLTIREIMEKHLKGLRISESLQREGFNDEGSDFDSQDVDAVGRMDIAEQAEYYAALEADFKQRKRDLASVQAKLTERKRKDAEQMDIWRKQQSAQASAGGGAGNDEKEVAKRTTTKKRPTPPMAED